MPNCWSCITLGSNFVGNLFLHGDFLRCLSLFHPYLDPVVIATSHPPLELTLLSRYVKSLTISTSMYNCYFCYTVSAIFPSSHLLQAKCFINIKQTYNCLPENVLEISDGHLGEQAMFFMNTAMCLHFFQHLFLNWLKVFRNQSLSRCSGCNCSFKSNGRVH